MSRIKKALYVIIPALLLVVTVIKLKNNMEIAEQKVYQLDKNKAIVVKGHVILLERMEDVQLFSGTFHANKETKVSAEGQGKITSLWVEEGDHVTKGQALAQLDDRMIKLQIENIEVQIEGLQDDVDRYEILNTADAVQGIKLEKAQIALKTAQVQRATLQEQLDKTTVRAPFSGIVSMKMTELGSFAAPGMPLFLLTDINRLKFLFQVSEYDLKKFQKGHEFDLSVDVFSDRVVKGVVTMVSDRANDGGSYTVQLDLSNSEKPMIKSGMYGKLRSVTSSGKEGVIIRSSWILDRSGQKSVYIVKEGTAKLQDIVVDQNIEERITIKEGLQAGDTIITEGFINLFDGANVNVKLN